MKSWSIITCCFCVFVLLITCKKDNQTAPPVSYNVTGTWALSGYKTTYFDMANISTSVQYPCMAQNKTTYLANGTLINVYTGDSVCYITPYVYSSSPVSNGRVSVGEVGAAPDTAATWKVNGNILQEKFSNPAEIIYGTLSLVNGKLQAILTDTLNYTGGPYYSTTILVKQ